MEYWLTGLLGIAAFFCWTYWPRKPRQIEESAIRKTVCIHTKDQDGNDMIITKVLDD